MRVPDPVRPLRVPLTKNLGIRHPHPLPLPQTFVRGGAGGSWSPDEGGGRGLREGKKPVHLKCHRQRDFRDL